MHRACTRDVVSDLIPQTRCVHALEQAFSGADQDWRNGYMHLVDKSGTKVLPHGGNSAAKPDILTLRSVDSLFQRGFNTIRDEMERSASAHSDRCAWVLGENKNRSVVRRSVAPPALPRVIRPWSANRPKHVAPNNPRADTLEAARHHVIVNPSRAAIVAMHLLVGPSGKLPTEYRQAANANWILEALVWAGTVAIERNRKAVNTKFGHKSRLPDRHGRFHLVRRVGQLFGEIDELT
jgi:hypothetical protein